MDELTKLLEKQYEEDNLPNFEKAGLLSGLTGKLKDYVNENYKIVARYILSLEDIKLEETNTCITTIIFPLIRCIIGGERSKSPNYVILKDPEKFLNFVRNTWKEKLPDFMEMAKISQIHGIYRDAEGELLRYVADLADSIIKNDEEDAYETEQ